MSRRNFSMVEYFNRLAKDRRPVLTFTGESSAEWARWREAFAAKLRELCGEWPQPVPLSAEAVSRIDAGEFIREKVVLDTEPHLSLPAYVLVPKDRRRARNGRLPAILCLHGHGPFGKEPVAGVVDLNRPGLADEIARRNYDYGAQMAREGYLTLAPDSRVFGELGDGGDPYPGRDPCNVHFIRGALLGVYLLTLNIWDTMKSLDYLQTRPDVDGERLGAMGLSWGGARTMFLAALDERVRAADIICSLSRSAAGTRFRPSPGAGTCCPWPIPGAGRPRSADPSTGTRWPPLQGSQRSGTCGVPKVSSDSGGSRR